MATVSVRTLKDELSDYLRRAEAGERVTVTRDGKPVAAIVALAELGTATEEAALALMVQSGKLSQMPARLLALPPLLDIGAGTRISTIVTEDRR